MTSFRAALLASATPEAQEALRGYVRQALQDERRERQEKARQRSQEWQREMKAMREGPYGKYNFKINSMAKKLDLSDAQKQILHDSLVWYDDEKAALKRSIQRNTPEGAKEYTERKGELAAQFED